MKGAAFVLMQKELREEVGRDRDGYKPVKELPQCVVCGSGMMIESPDGVTCGELRCRDGLAEKVRGLLDVDQEAVIDLLREENHKLKEELVKIQEKKDKATSLLRQKIRKIKDAEKKARELAVMLK